MDALQIMHTADHSRTVPVGCPSLPEVATFGGTDEECLRRSRSAIEEAIARRIANGSDLSGHAAVGTRIGVTRTLKVRPPLMTSLKAELCQAFRTVGMIRVDLARRLGGNGTSVDRLVTVDHALHLNQIGSGAEALGRNFQTEMIETMCASTDGARWPGN